MLTSALKDKRAKLEPESSTDSPSRLEHSPPGRSGLQPGLPGLREEQDQSKSSSPTGSHLSHRHSPMTASPPSGAIPRRASPHEHAHDAPHMATLSTLDSRRYWTSDGIPHGPSLPAAHAHPFGHGESNRCARRSLFSHSSSSSSATLPSLSHTSSSQSQESSASNTPGTPFFAMMQEGAPRSSRVLPAPAPTGQPSNSYVLDHRPLPHKPALHYAPDDPRASSSLAALLRASELAREADQAG